MKNKISETITENIFRAYYGASEFIEKSAIPSEYGFKSKNNKLNDGFPDFLKDCKDYVIVVEAKSNNHNKAKKEVNYYMKNNDVTKDIIGIAISGQSKNELSVTIFLQIYNSDVRIEIYNDNKLISLINIDKLYKRSKRTEITSIENLNKTLTTLNTQFHKENIVRDTERSLFFSGIMIALKDSSFRKTYLSIEQPSIEESKTSKTKLFEAHILNDSIVNAITRQIDIKVNTLSKEYNWRDKFSFIKTIDYPLIKYKKMIKLIEDNIFVPFENEEKLDILGKAYKIFLSRAGKVDNKNIIMTPDHIKSLMVKLARLNLDDVILDTCTGTGGFLMESMETLIEKAKGNDEIIKKIHEEKLIGFEIDAVLFALACSNMFLHGDGRTNLIYRSSLLNDGHDNIVDEEENELFENIRSRKPTKIIINPPYENNKPIKFVKQAIDYLEPNGKLIIIMPTPTLTHNQGKNGDEGLTEKVLKDAKLDFAIRMPENLFAEQKRTVNTSIFGFTKTPHIEDDPVLFYNLEDDGFKSIQHKGRIDRGNWDNLETDIINDVIGLVERQGVSKKQKIYKNGVLNCAGIKAKRNSNYKMVKIGDLFDITEGTLASESCEEYGEYDFITASAEWKKHTEYDRDCEAIVFAVAASGSLGRTHYVNGKFIASNLCVILTPLKDSDYEINMKFYNHYFDSVRKQLRSDLADGTSKLTIRVDDLREYYIEYIPKKEQDSFCENNIIKYEQICNQLKILKNELNSNLSKMFNN